jgi:hypothetical protein
VRTLTTGGAAITALKAGRSRVVNLFPRKQLACLARANPTHEQGRLLVLDSERSSTIEAVSGEREDKGRYTARGF